ncbi:MAG: methyltransferase [Candidatus Micrarchaeaceae archaeon]
MYKEGKASIRYTKGSFLNPDALMSRDISAAFVSSMSTKKTKVLDATAATGIRGIRYYLEAKAKDVTMLEMNSSAFASLKANVRFNKVKAKAIDRSIQSFANATKEKFDVIDLDPFGGATPYVYDLMKISKDGTCMMITVTDTAVLCGADYKACMRLYDARPMHNELCHEVGLRLLIGYVARTAAQFNFGIEVLASFDYLHYMRIFVRLRHGSVKAIESIKSMGYVQYCSSCLNRIIDSSAFPKAHKCGMCNSQLETSGKVWLGPIENRSTLTSIISEIQGNPSLYSIKSLEFIKGIHGEAASPLYYAIPKVTKRMGIGSVSNRALIQKLTERGFSASPTHMSKYSVKTDASIKEVKSCILGLSKSI